MTPRRVSAAVVGSGYWGINQVRTLAAEPRVDLTYVCDLDDGARQRALRMRPQSRVTAKLDDVLASPVEAVVLATPAVTHEDLACRVLAAGKHLLVEKPLALSPAGAERIAAAAADAGKVLLVGHIMLYHPAVQKLGALLRSGELGHLFYLYSSRLNLGRLRRDENALWSLGPHDLSMIDYLLGELPETVSARGESYLQDGVEDVVFVTLRFRGGEMAHVHLSWLDPKKERRLTLVCSQKMVEFDDVAADKLRIYDKGYDRPPAFTRFDEYLTIRQGGVHIPHVPMQEPLAVEVRHFVDCILEGGSPLSDAASAIRVVRVLAAAEESLRYDGAPVLIADAAR